MYRPGFMVLACALLFPAVALASPAPVQKARDLEIAGDDVVVEAGERYHDVHAFGGNVTVLGEVTGSVSAFGGNVRVVGPVKGDVRLFGGNLDVEGHVGGDVELMGGDLEVRGVVDGDAKLTGGDVRVYGLVRGDVTSAGGDVTRKDGGRVLGRVQENAAAFMMDLDKFITMFPLPDWALAIVPGTFSVVTALFTMLKLSFWGAAFCLGVLLLAVNRLRFATYQEALTVASLPSLGWGAVAIMVTFTLIIVCCITVVALPVAGLLFLTLISAHALGLAFVAAAVGSFIPSRFIATRSWAQLCVGTFLCSIATLVPYAGGLLMLVASIAGIGAIVLSHKKPSPARPLPATSMSITTV